MRMGDCVRFSCCGDKNSRIEDLWNLRLGEKNIES